MEVVEITQENKFLSNQENRSRSKKCSKKYVQPPRAPSFAPKRAYCPPKQHIDATTTYLKSYYTDKPIIERPPKPILPSHSICMSEDKFANDTTNKLSFKPVWGIHRAKAISPRDRLRFQGGRMENTTTIRQSYVPKIAPRVEPIAPCNHIRTSQQAFEGQTTTLLSYINPGHVEPVESCRPKLKYCPPKIPIPKETTQKLSYLPYQIGKKENYPWAMKPVYRRPDVPIPGDTTYTKSYFENKARRELPIMPRDACVFPTDDKFIKSTIYKESFLPVRTDLVTPILPCGNITFSEQKMLCDTTNKLSFLPVKGEKRKLIMPRNRKILGDHGFTSNVTTNQLSYTPKIARRPDMIMPCNHIRTADQPIEDKTTTALSFVKPGYVEQAPNYRPKLKYCKPEQKVEDVTVNKLSFPQWQIGPKDDMPWARQKDYCPPKDKMATTTVCHMSFPAPGYYIEECTDETDESTTKDRGDN